MGSWKKQSVPLVFLEVAMDAIKKGANNPSAYFVELVGVRFERRVEACWAPLRDGKERVAYDDAVKVTVGVAARIQRQLDELWGGKGINCVGELSNAMAGIADDTLRQLPTGRRQDRIDAWSAMADLCVELCAVTGTDDVDDDCYRMAARIADIVRAEVER